MEAIIKTNNKTLFKSLLRFLKSLDINVETKEEKVNGIKMTKQPHLKTKSDKEIKSFYNSIRVDMSHYKFDRNEANERYVINPYAIKF